jgi:hypothetical protein
MISANRKTLAKQNPGKLRDLQGLFLTEARKYNVLPLDSSFVERGDPTTRPNPIRGVMDFMYYPGMIRIPEDNSPNIKNRSFRIMADVEIPHGGAQGVPETQGGRFGSWALLVLDGKPEFVYAYSKGWRTVPDRMVRLPEVGAPLGHRDSICRPSLGSTFPFPRRRRHSRTPGRRARADWLGL